jgi:hypothetical protein
MGKVVGTGWLRGLFGGSAALAAAVIVACSGSSTSEVTSGQPDSGAVTGEGGPDEGGNPDGALIQRTYTLDDVCERTALEICQFRKSCCQAGPGYDEATCLTYTKGECAKDVAATRAGTQQFHAELIDRCLVTYQRIFSTSCELSIDALATVAPELAGCHIFTGSLAEGSPCTRDSECKPSDAPSALTSCAGDTHTCHTTRFLALGDDCTYATGLPELCGAGLYCSVTFEDDGGVLPGKCKPKTPLAGACSGTVECGLGNYCDTTCHAGQSGGAACTDANQCASLSCSAKTDGGAKTCADAQGIVKPAECGKP